MFHYDGFYGILNSFNLARFGNFNFRFNFNDRFFNKNIGTTPEQASEPQANEALPQAEQPAAADSLADGTMVTCPSCGRKYKLSMEGRTAYCPVDGTQLVPDGSGQ